MYLLYKIAKTYVWKFVSFKHLKNNFESNHKLQLSTFEKSENFYFMTTKSMLFCLYLLKFEVTEVVTIMNFKIWQLKITVQAFLDFCGFDFCNFWFNSVYNSILFSFPLVLVSNLDLHRSHFLQFFMCPHINSVNRGMPVRWNSRLQNCIVIGWKLINIWSAMFRIWFCYGIFALAHPYTYCTWTFNCT